jgi:hypothetical protein
MQQSDDSSEESGAEDFFTKTSKVREIASDDEQEIVPTKLSKRKMNKITAEGPYQGKNVTVFTEDGTKVSKDAHERKKYLDSLKINMRDENDVESDSDEQQNYLETVRSNLLKTKEEDTKLAKQKLKEKRIKSKKRQRGAQDGSEDDDGVQLASQQSGELSELSQEPSESEQYSSDSK